MKLSFSIKTITLLLLITVSSLATITTTTTAQTPSSTQWQLTINGLVDHPLTLTIDDLKALPNTTEEATIFCVDFPTFIVTTGIWTGVSLSTLFEKAGLQPSATKVAFYASDQYSTDLDLATAMNSAIMVAYSKDGAPLSETLRLVVPGRWGYKWISQLTTITLVNCDYKGKWESAGYPDDALATSAGGPAPPQIVPEFPNSNSPQPNSTATQSAAPTAYNVTASTPPENAKTSTPEVNPQSQNLLSPPLEISLVVIATVCVGFAAFAKKRRNSEAAKTD